MKRLHDSEIEEVFPVYILSHRRLLTRIDAIQERNGERYLWQVFMFGSKH